MSRPKSENHLRAVVGILQKDRKILVSQRPSDKIYAGYWEFPGGKIEPNELALDALKRELREELAIDVIKSKAWFDHTHIYPDKTVALSIWLVDQYKGDVQPNEGQVLKWVTLQEMQALNLLEGNLPILEKIKTLYSL